MQVCVAKGALTAQMPARTTVIAAANPAGAHHCHLAHRDMHL
jgi:DNA replicative helicase MCM subunit Mcm2 (Cdc46/Mcm family)